MKTVLTLCLFTIPLLAAGCSSISTAATQDQVPTTTTAPAPVRSLDDQLIFYHSESCSHCKSAISQIRNGRIDQYLNISMKEVSQDDNDYREFYSRIQACNIPAHQIGVPMMWDGYRCYQGVDIIMNELGERMKLIK